MLKELLMLQDKRLKLWDIPDEQINRIKETGKPIRTLKIYSPVNGYVYRKLQFRECA